MAMPAPAPAVRTRGGLAPRILLVAGEASGDGLGAGLVEALRRRYPDARFAGIGGDAMRRAGVETWYDGQLAGGLYGVSVGQVFCGESMFSRKANASKVALASLCQSNAYALIDCQVYTAHLASLGARMIPREVYRRYIARS